MKKIMIATLGLSLLSGIAVFAQNTSTGGGMGGTDTMSKGKKSKKSKKGKDTSSTTSTSTSSK